MGGGSSVPASVGPVVIIGAGYAGTQLAVILKKGGGNYTLIDGQDSFHHCVASVRAVVKEATSRQMFLSLSDAFGSRFVNERVESIHPEDKMVKLSDDTELTYGILVIATGALVSFPGKVEFEKKEEAIEKYVELQRKVKSSQRIVVAGGGPVGVEIAAEIATEFKDKKVTLIHSGQRLCHPDANDKFQKIVNKFMANAGVEVILGEKVTNLDDLADEGNITIVTNKDRQFPADMVIRCTGGLKVRSDAFAVQLGSATDENGALKVNEYFQVQGYDDIYAIGDCCNTVETKLASVASEHAKLLADNLIKKANGKAMKPYVAGKRPHLMGVSLGKKHGVLQLAGGTIPPEFLITTFKSSDLMVKRIHGTLGLKVPK